MVIEHFILARASSIDHEKNTMSVFEFIEDIHVRTNRPEGTIPLTLQAIIVFRRDSEVGQIDYKATFRAIRPNGEPIINQTLPISMRPQHRRHRVRLNLALPITDSGDYKFAVHIEGREVAKELILSIRKEREQPPS